jgi:divalent metal cation (Fe/Co/Zn/Cd) transporter
VGKVLPGADVVVEVEPVRADHEDLPTTIRLLAARHELGAHGIRIYDLGTGGHTTELHLEVRDGLTLDEAHAQATAFEQALREAVPGITEVVTHLEPVGEGIARRAQQRRRSRRHGRTQASRGGTRHQLPPA